MKGYLLLEDGTTYPGIVDGGYSNALGAIKVLDAASMKIQIEGQTIVLCKDENCMRLNLKSGTSHLAKIIVDKLPLEFHLYDLKTTVC